ncbi:SRPBCC family protein [Actinomycetospora cinnamomea]|uniref:Polyketide cyclase/dehydrase/lipid transport protein n=1 Tax=Actinomycetospora cinnamomea TaxID=663609 RepID=A0A2U1F6B5_9PSEU|nr:SRPBCC family protein [Actinomycetospora cinnamomea]PVZ07725.1 polyketide cyclase/dehydrase/lipid transport protein [Actinomycetospora cinnamomea]
MSKPVTRSIEIDAPVSRVVEVISDLENTDRWANEAKSARVTEHDEHGRPAKIDVTLGAIGFTTTSTYAVSYTDDAITLTCVAGKLIEESTIAYRIHSRGDGGSRVEMSSTMEVTVPVPRWGLERAMGSSAEKNLASIKKDAEAS